MSLAKSLTIAAYGESVASYRYRTLAEKTRNENHRRVFTEMADEEQEHHTHVQSLLKKHFPDENFVLTPADKESVIVGPRNLDPAEHGSTTAVLKTIQESERLTGRFYAALAEAASLTELRSIFKEMADECFDHAERLNQLYD